MLIANNFTATRETAQSKQMLALVKADNGFARVYYRDNERRLYCFLQQRRNVFELFACTKDGEPSHPVGINGFEIDRLPAGDTSTETAFRTWHSVRA